ncbi:MAG: hypothetical protein IPM25_11500 [Chloracidobacterium sp.]|nr:hypothetical protein [Chloracidobacterium sp.]
MKNTISALVLLSLSAICVLGQTDRLPPGVHTLELLSPFVQDSTGRTIGTNPERRGRSCLDLVNLRLGCSREVTVDFGTRMGVNINLFKLNGGKVDRSRMVRIGAYDWTDKFIVPYIEPWSELAPGETRHVAFNVSGGDGPDGKPGLPGVAGMNGDGTYTPTVIPPAPIVRSSSKPKRKDYGTADVTEQVSSKIVAKNGKERKDGYTPLVLAKKGHMYAVHVVDGNRDYYVLIRVDDIEEGERIKISFMKLDLTEAL